MGSDQGQISDLASRTIHAIDVASVERILLMTNLSASDLRRAAAIKDKIESLQAELTKVLGGREVGNGSAASPTGKKTGRRKMSAAGRAKIAAAAKARWAKVKAAGRNRL